MSASDLRHAFDRLADIPKAVTRDVSKMVETVAADMGGSVTITRRKTTKRLRLRGVTKYENVSANTASATVFGVPTGPWVWKNEGTRSGYNIPKWRKATRVYLHGEGYEHPIGVQIQSTGRGGTGVWRRVVDKGRDDAYDVAVRAVDDIVRAVA